MYRYCRSVELPIARCTNSKTGVTAHNRAILVQWIAEIQDAYLRAETLFLIVGIVDRFLAKKDVSLDDLQLIGLGALHIGMKYEESWNFSLLELVDLCAGAYSTNQILEKLEQMAVALAREKSAIDGWGLNASKKKYGRGFASCEKLLHRALASVQLMEFPLI
ncbi:hypothetical protein ACHAXT_011656 [Thalassiosira profunda]